MLAGQVEAPPIDGLPRGPLHELLHRSGEEARYVYLLRRPRSGRRASPETGSPLAEELAEELVEEAATSQGRSPERGAPAPGLGRMHLTEVLGSRALPGTILLTVTTAGLTPHTSHITVAISLLLPGRGPRPGEGRDLRPFVVVHNTRRFVSVPGEFLMPVAALFGGSAFYPLLSKPG